MGHAALALETAMMVEFALIVALILVLRRLRRRPTRIEVHYYFHGLPTGPGELRPVSGGNVVPFRRTSSASTVATQLSRSAKQ